MVLIDDNTLRFKLQSSLNMHLISVFNGSNIIASSCMCTPLIMFQGDDELALRDSEPFSAIKFYIIVISLMVSVLFLPRSRFLIVC